MKIKKRKLSLTIQILIALVLGIIFGICIHYLLPGGVFKDHILIGGIFHVVGNGFIRAIQMLVVPLVFCSLICGVLSMGDTKKLGKVGVQTLLLYLITTILAITIALFIGKLLNPGLGVNLSSLSGLDTSGITNSTIDQMSMADTILNIIPSNPIGALAEGNMLQTIFFALLLGLVLAYLGEKSETIAHFFEEGNDIMMILISWIMKFAPIGVFCLIATTFANTGWAALLPIMKYVLTVYVALAVQCFGVYQLMLYLLTKLNPIKFVRKYLPVTGFAFSTSSSNACIPMSISTLQNRLGVSSKISSFTIPIGATINMDGTAIMQGVAVIFIAQVFHVDLTFMDYLTVIATATLSSIGTAGAPGVGIITLAMVFNSIGLPIEGIALIMGVDRLVDMARTAVNVTGSAVCTTIVAKKSQDVDMDVYNDMKKKQPPAVPSENG